MSLNFSYGIIGIVGVLVAISIGFISESPDDIPEPRIIELEKPTVCTMQWDPMCGVDGETYGNSCMLDAADVKLDYAGECLVVEPTPEPTVEPTPEPTVEPTPEPTVEPELVMEVPESDAVDVEEMVVESAPEIIEDLSSFTISIPSGTGVPGCEETNECFLPYEASVSVGTTVTWSNDDTAAHTVTSGNVNAGPTGVFDSGLFMAGSTFDFTFEDTGKYDYFCMVHPWMTGFVDVS